jgi:hypothetical protein
MLVQDCQTDELLLGRLVDAEFVGSECLVDGRNGVVGEVLLQIIVCSNHQFEAALDGSTA